MRRIASILSVLVLLAVIPTSGFAACTGGAPSFFCTNHITSQTTTAVLAAATGKTVSLMGGSLCVDATGANTGVAIQSTGGTNTIGTNIVYVLAPGQCLWFPTRTKPYGLVTASGTGLQIVTTVGNGPVEAVLEVLQQ